MAAKIGVILFLAFLLYLVLTIGSTKPKVAAVAVTPTIEQPTLTPTPSDINAVQLTKDINAYRKGMGLQPFIEDPRLCDIAQKRAIEQNTLGYLDHHAGILKFYTGEYVFSENDVGPARDVNGAYTSWFHSPPHRSAIEGTWKYACLRTKGGFAVQIFSSFDQVNHNAAIR